MGIIRQVQEFHDFDEAPAEFAAIMRSIIERPGCCVFCGATATDDGNWPVFAVELENIDTGATSPDIQFPVCRSCEPKADAFLERLIAAERGIIYLTPLVISFHN